MDNQQTNTYRIGIKSHTDAPDYVDSCKAHSKKEAAVIFALRLSRQSDSAYSSKELEGFIDCDLGPSLKGYTGEFGNSSIDTYGEKGRYE